MLNGVERAVADAHRREWAYVLAATVRVTRDLDAAEEAVQDAYVRALRTWARDGVPDRPGAWLTTVARRGALNVMRRQQTLEARLPLLLEPEGTEASERDTDTDAIPDDRLRLVFTCCHPALAQEAQIALTLRLVCGVATADIAQAFLVAEATMAARLTRAKKKIAAARIRYSVPSADELPERVDAVLTVLSTRPGTPRTRVKTSYATNSPAARSTWRACCGCCCRPTARRRGCWRCCSSTTRAARRAPTRTAGCYASRSRTAPRGTAR